VATGKISTDTTHHAVSQRVAELLVYNQQCQSIRENSKQKKLLTGPYLRQQLKSIKLIKIRLDFCISISPLTESESSPEFTEDAALYLCLKTRKKDAATLRVLPKGSA